MEKENLSDAGKWIIKTHIEELSKIKNDHELVDWLDGVAVCRLTSSKAINNVLRELKGRDL